MNKPSEFSASGSTRCSAAIWITHGLQNLSCFNVENFVARVYAQESTPLPVPSLLKSTSLGIKQVLNQNISKSFQVSITLKVFISRNL